MGSGEDLTSCQARNENLKQWWEGGGGGERQERKALGVLVLLWSWEFAHSLLQKAAQPGCSAIKPELKPGFSA